jgi:Tol biopolymer transport system component
MAGPASIDWAGVYRLIADAYVMTAPERLLADLASTTSTGKKRWRFSLYDQRPATVRRFSIQNQTTVAMLTIPLAAHAMTYPRITPDGGRVALYMADRENDLWLWDVVRETLTRLTFEPGLDIYPIWTPDSRRLIFSSERGGRRAEYFLAARWRQRHGRAAIGES